MRCAVEWELVVSAPEKNIADRWFRDEIKTTEPLVAVVDDENTMRREGALSTVLLAAFVAESAGSPLVAGEPLSVRPLLPRKTSLMRSAKIK